MSVRYFIISSLIVVGLAVAIGVYTDRKSAREVAVIAGLTVAALTAIAALVYGLSRLLVVLGVVESGFVM